MAKVQFFEWTGDEFKLNVPEILLVTEFENLFKYGKAINDDMPFKYFKFLYLAYNYGGPYRDISEIEAVMASLSDCGFTIEDVDFPIMAMAAYKYKSLLHTSLSLLLMSARNVVHKIREHYDAIDFMATDDHGRQKYKVGDAIKQIKDLGFLDDGISELERKVQMEMGLDRGIRGDNEEGYNN